MLLQQGRPGKPLTRAPFRLSAIHAIELYLTALLLQRGQNPNQIRKRQHDLSARTEHALEAGLRLRTKTATHLQSLSQKREYLVTVTALNWRQLPRKWAALPPPLKRWRQRSRF